MDKPAHSRLLSLMDDSEHPVGLCMLALLGWLAICDNRLAPEELLLLKEYASANAPDEDIEALLIIIQDGNIAELQIACQYLKEHFDDTQKQLFIRMAIGVVIEDSLVKSSEQHVLGFIADLFEIDPSQLQQMFGQITGRNLMPLGDPSDMHWWQLAGHSEQLPGSHAAELADTQNDTEPEPVERNLAFPPWDRRRLDHNEALALLGLDDNAEPQHIRQAYTRLTAAHHPERFRALGEHAVKAATLTMDRINTAYQYLLVHERSV